MAREFKHLTSENRREIKFLLSSGYSIKEIAARLSVHISTIYKELKRGKIDGIYDPFFAQEVYEKNLANKGADSIISENIELATRISDLIIKNGNSPEEIVEILHKDGRFKAIPKSHNTIYKAIDDGMIPGVTRERLKQKNLRYNYQHVTIPKWLKDELGWEEGMEISFKIDGETLILSKTK